MEAYSKAELGMKRANPNAIGSMVALTDKDYVGVTPALDEVTLTTSGNFESFVFDGVTVTLASAIAINAGNLEAIELAINDEVSKKEHTVWIEATYAGGDLTIKHIGHLRLASIGVSDVAAGAQQATTLKSTLVSVCKYSVQNVVDTIGPVEYLQTTDALANDPYAHVGTPATDDATAAQLATDLAASLATLGITLYSAAVTAARDDVNTAYDIEFEAQKATSVIILQGAGVFFTESNCREEFV